MDFNDTTGFAYTIKNARIDVAGRKIVGINKITWTETMEGAEQIPGASLLYIAETTGTYKATCEFEILWTEFARLTKALGSGYMLKRFNVGAQVQLPGGPLSSLFVPQCRIIDAGGSLEDKASYRTVKCSVSGVISLDGVTAIDTGSFAGGNVIGGSASVVAQVGASLGFSL